MFVFFDDEITDKQDAKMRELLLRLQEEDTYCLAVFVVDVAWRLALVF